MIKGLSEQAGTHAMEMRLMPSKAVGVKKLVGVKISAEMGPAVSTNMMMASQLMGRELKTYG